MKSRLHYIDQIRGIAIVLVVQGHFLQSCTIDSTKNYLFGIIYSFHMPLFMFISGYIANRTTSSQIFNNYFTFLKKKFQGLLIPYFTWLFFVDQYIFTKQINYNWRDLINTVATGGGYWFLFFLFWLYIIFSGFLLASHRLNKPQSLLIDGVINIIVLSLLFIIKKLNIFEFIDSLILYYGFFFFGVFVDRHDVVKRVFTHSSTFVICLIAFGLLASHYDFASKIALNKILKIIIAISAIVCIYYGVIKMQWNSFIDKYITLLGENTLVIYLTHYKFINIFPLSHLLLNLPILALLFISVLSSLLVIAFCFGVSAIIELSPPLNFLLYGKLNRRI